MKEGSHSVTDRIKKLVSGGQTGVDRGALDAAMTSGIDHGGWCPRGRRAEDGCIPSHYNLKETEVTDYSVRTEKNVVDSDGTLIIYRSRLRGGTELTYRFAVRYARPCLLLDLDAPLNPVAVKQWIADQQVRILNVAGPRESSCAGIAEKTRRLMIKILG